MLGISDAALDNYYANIFEGSYGYDPYEGPYQEDETEDDADDIGYTD